MYALYLDVFDESLFFNFPVGYVHDYRAYWKCTAKNNKYIQYYVLYHPFPHLAAKVSVQIVNIYVQLLTPTQLFYRKGLKTLFYKRKFI
jgi:hypothetical protein